MNWLTARDVLKIEASARERQEAALADVISLADELVTLFIPDLLPALQLERADGSLDRRLQTMIVIESGAFGHLRSLRAAISDGRIQDVASQARTLEVLCKKTVLAIFRPGFAERAAEDKRFQDLQVDTWYEEVLATLGRPGATTPSVYDKQSALLHARHIGLQFQLSEEEGVITVSRSPVSTRLSDCGRSIALQSIDYLRRTVMLVVPELLRAAGLPTDDWTTRAQDYLAQWNEALVPYDAMELVLAEDATAAVEVDCEGRLLVDGAVAKIVVNDQPASR